MTQPSPQSFIESVLKERLAERGITSQHAFAKALGKSQGWVSQFFYSNPEECLKNLFVNDNPTFEIILSLLEWNLETLIKTTKVQLSEWRFVQAYVYQSDAKEPA